MVILKFHPYIYFMHKLGEPKKGRRLQYCHPSIHPVALQPKLGLGLLYWGSMTMFYGVKLLASWPTPVNFEGPMIFSWGFTPLAKGSSFKALKTRSPSHSPSHSHLLHWPCTTTRRLRVWVCWQSLQVEYTESFLVFNRACLLASGCPTRAIPAFGPTNGCL
jgi:hypothetical protein